MKDIPVEQIRESQDLFLETMRNTHQAVLASLGAGELTDEAIKAIEEVMASISQQYKN